MVFLERVGADTMDLLLPRRIVQVMKYQQDPEVASNTVGDAYLNQRVLNIGLQVGL